MHERTTDAAETAVPLPEPEGRSYTPGERERARAMTSAEAGRPAGRPRVARWPLVSADRLLLTLLAGMFVLAAAVLSAGAVAFNALSDQLLTFRTEMRQEIGDLRTEMREEIGDLREEIGDLHEEIGKLSDRMDQLSNRMTRIETLIETHLVPASNPPDPAGRQAGTRGRRLPTPPGAPLFGAAAPAERAKLPWSVCRVA